MPGARIARDKNAPGQAAGAIRHDHFANNRIWSAQSNKYIVRSCAILCDSGEKLGWTPIFNCLPEWRIIGDGPQLSIVCPNCAGGLPGPQQTIHGGLRIFPQDQPLGDQVFDRLVDLRGIFRE